MIPTRRHRSINKHELLTAFQLQLFNPEKLPGIKDVPGLAEYAKGLTASYAQYVLPSFESAEDLQPGDGTVVQKVGTQYYA